MTKKILIVDDDDDVIETLSIPLIANNYSIISVKDIDQIFPVIEKEKPNLIILDVIFPDNPTAGFEICRDIKKHEKYKHIPVIMLSAINHQFNMGFSNKIKNNDWLPADLFLEKPLDLDELLKTVKTFLNDNK